MGVYDTRKIVMSIVRILCCSERTFPSRFPGWPVREEKPTESRVMRRTEDPLSQRSSTRELPVGV